MYVDKKIIKHLSKKTFSVFNGPPQSFYRRSVLLFIVKVYQGLLKMDCKLNTETLWHGAVKQ